DGEQILLIDADAAGEAQAGPVVPGQGDGRRRRQARALGQPPRGAGSGRAARAVGAAAAELGIEGVPHAFGAEQLQRRRVLVDGLAVVGQEQVVDAPAGQGQGAGQGAGADRHPRAVETQGDGAVLGEDGGAGGRGGGRTGGGGRRGLLGGATLLRLR